MFATSGRGGSLLLQSRGVGGGGEAGGQNLLLLTAAEDVTDLGTNVGREKTVNEGIGGRVEGGQTLEKSGDGGVHGDQVVDLEERKPSLSNSGAYYKRLERRTCRRSYTM